MFQPRLIALLVLLPLALVVSGCYEDPVTEDLVVRFTPEGFVEATAHVGIMRIVEGERELLDRLSELRLAYMRGDDPWSRRFERLPLLMEERTLTRERNDRGGSFDLTRVRHSATVHPDDLALLFSGSNVTALYQEGAGWRELVLIPGRTGSADPGDRQIVLRELDAWSEAVVRYLDTIENLYGFLEARPDRASAIFQNLFDDLSQVDATAEYPLGESEADLVKEARDAMVAVADKATSPSADRSRTLNELSLAVFDPFPARVSVCLPEEPEEVEGFVRAEDRCWDVPRPGLIGALGALEGRWIAPDPLPAWLEAHRDREQISIDPEVWAAAERVRGPVPAPAEVRAAIEETFGHSPLYRLRWWWAPEAP